jgi:DNA-binding IclR family transcriptional regulator
VEDGLVTPGLGSVAVAVLDHNDYPVAGVAVTFAQADVDDAATARLVAAVRKAAAGLSTRLGRAIR